MPCDLISQLGGTGQGAGLVLGGTRAPAAEVLGSLGRVCPEGVRVPVTSAAVRRRAFGHVVGSRPGRVLVFVIGFTR